MLCSKAQILLWGVLSQAAFVPEEHHARRKSIDQGLVGIDGCNPRPQAASAAPHVRLSIRGRYHGWT